MRAAGSVLTRAKTRAAKRLCSDDSGVLKNPDKSPMEEGIYLSCWLLVGNHEWMGYEGETMVPQIDLTDTGVEWLSKRVIPDAFFAINVPRRAMRRRTRVGR